MRLLVTTALILAMSTAAFAQTTATPAARSDRAQVERAQRALKDAGHDPGAIDGVMGAQTAAALKAYQKEQGLNPTGRLDEPTMAKLGSAEPSASNSSAPSAKAERSSTQTGGSQKSSPADPAQGTKTGGNVGEGASYSRSNEKK